MAKPSVEELITRIDTFKGNVSAVARSYGVSRTAVHRWIKDSVTATQALHDARETMIDNVESRFYQNCMDGDTTAMIFFLKTQAKHRGYTERTEVTGKDGDPIEFRAIAERVDSRLDRLAARIREGEDPPGNRTNGQGKGGS